LKATIKGYDQKIESIKDDIIVHKVGTLPGQSGSSILAKIGEDYYIVGMHQKGGDGFINYGTTFTR
jgi:V8-like Glu-specific endopeptidase